MAPPEAEQRSPLKLPRSADWQDVTPKQQGKGKELLVERYGQWYDLVL